MPNVNMFAPTPRTAPQYGADTTHLGNSVSQVWDDRFKQGAQPNALGGQQPGATGPNPLISSYLQRQTAENARSRAANTGRWDAASNYLKGFSTPFSPDVLAKMKSQNAMLSQGGANNEFRQQQGLMGASGQGDASSTSAALAEASRHALGAQVGANTQLGIQAAQANNAAGMNVGQSILANLPQDRPQDFSGFASMGLADANQNYLRSLTENQMNRPVSPGMTAGSRPIGGRYSNDTSGGAGFNWMQPPTPPTSRLNTVGQRMDGTYRQGEEEMQQRRLMGGF